MTGSTYDVAVVGGGPAGLAVALEAVLRGHSAVVFERQAGPVDKACGEGLMPAGLSALERLGVLPYLDRADSAAFDSITYVQEDGRSVRARLPAPGGLGIRRLALAAAMQRRARQVGVVLHESCGVRSHRIDPDGVSVTTDQGETRAKVLVAADGLNSALRRAEGLDEPWAGPRRFGLRRHVAMQPWAPTVEVHFAKGVEAYVTPAGVHRVGVAFLWHQGSVDPSVTFDALLAHFPHLERRVAGHPFDSEPRGAGPLRQHVSTRVKNRFVLVGDAAGYIDAITGEGLSLAFDGAATLGRLWGDIFADGASERSLLPYEYEMQRVFARYSRLARTLVWAARHPTLRRFVINRLIDAPKVFEWALKQATASPHAPPPPLPAGRRERALG